MKADFYKGVDISSLQESMDGGMQVYDENGQKILPFELLKQNGVNMIRLRIWHTPENVPESGGYCSLEHTLALAQKIKEYGMGFMLDFHYSDFWADPAQQRKPKQWENYGFEGLRQAVYDYTKETLLVFKQQGLLPDIVQIGNEIRCGLLFPDGELPAYDRMVKLVNAGIQGAREAAAGDGMQIMIHLDQGGRYTYLKEWLERSFENDLQDFDIIGLSFYPFWHGTFLDLKETMTKLVNDYHKPIMIVETAHAWRITPHGFIDKKQEKISGFAASPEGQRQVIELVMQITASIPEQMGQGVFYWEPLCLPEEGKGGWVENMGLLDEQGKVMPGMKAFNFIREDLCEEILGQISRINEREETVDEIEEETENLLIDSGWNSGLAHWKTSQSCKDVVVQILEKKVLKIEANRQFTFSICQDVEVEEGNYVLQAEFQGVDTTNVDVRLFAGGEAGEAETAVHPVEHEWDRYQLSKIKCKKGILTVGIRIQAPPMYIKIKGLCLTKKENI